MRFLFYALFLLILFPLGACAEEIKNLGFVQSSIWYDKEPFFAGENVRIYTILANSTEYDFQGSVVFYDTTEKIGSSSVTLGRFGGSQVVFADWKPTAGSHSITARIENALISKPGETPHSVELPQAISASSEKVVDLDTDADRIGNQKDTDDDGDGIPDVRDRDPLVVSSDDAKASIPAATTAGKIEQALEEAKYSAASHAPEVVAALSSVLEKTEGWRKSGVERIEEEKQALETSLKEKETTPDGASLWPNRLSLAALTLGDFAFKYQLIFYLFLGVFVWYSTTRLLGFLWRSIFHAS